MLMITAVGVLGIAWSPLSSAQAEAPRMEQAAPAYSDDELKSFAGAVIEVQRINLAYSPKLRAASSAEEQLQLARSASEAVENVVRNEGMSLARFEEILAHARADPELASRVKQHIQKTQ